MPASFPTFCRANRDWLSPLVDLPQTSFSALLRRESPRYRTSAKPAREEGEVASPWAAGAPSGGPSENPRRAADATPENDFACVHDNALVVGHAYHLMTFGGFNSHSYVQVDGAKSVAAVEGLWLAALGLTGQNGFIATPVRDFASLARFQIAAAFATSPADARSVGCAWHAVGVIDQRAVDALGRGCNTLPYQSCWLPGPNGSKVMKPDGVYCNEGYAASSYTCQSGSLKAGNACITGEACVVRDPTTRAAMLNATDEAACESAYP